MCSTGPTISIHGPHIHASTTADIKPAFSSYHRQVLYSNTCQYLYIFRTTTITNDFFYFAQHLNFVENKLILITVLIFIYLKSLKNLNDDLGPYSTTHS